VIRPSRPLRLALYYPWVYLPGGPERTISEILLRSRHGWDVYTNHLDSEATFPALRKASVRELERVSVKRSFFAVLQAAWRIARQQVPLEGYDALVIFCEGLGDFLLFRNSSVPAVCLCFTPLRAAFDTAYQRHYLANNPGRFWRAPLLAVASSLYKALDRRLWTKYRAVFAISQEVRRRIVEGHLYPEEKVGLLYPGVDTTRLVATGATSKNFLIPGRVMWTKNLELAIDAFQILLTRRPDLAAFTLTIAGHVDKKSEAYFERLQERAAACQQIQFRTSLSDEALFRLCDSAYAIVYPPFNEDWGLIPLEGMAFKKPVLAVNRGGPGETIVSGESGLLVDPDPDKFAAAMEMLADNPELVRRMGERAHLRAQQFDWKFFCNRLDDSLDELLDRQAPLQTLAAAAGGESSLRHP
jgi:glycosyltransferase involved in cell wall biosynthesis